MTSPLRVALRNRLTAAMRARDRQTAGAMRTVLAALENAESVTVASTGTSPAARSEHIAGAAIGVGAGEATRRVLSPEDERALVEREIAELRSSAAALAEAGRDERSAELVRLAHTAEDVLKG
jgi:uncharacterized protein YqeY